MAFTHLTVQYGTLLYLNLEQTFRLFCLEDITRLLLFPLRYFKKHKGNPISLEHQTKPTSKPVLDGIPGIFGPLVVSVKQYKRMRGPKNTIPVCKIELQFANKSTVFVPKRDFCK